MNDQNTKSISFSAAAFPVLALLALIVYGLLLRPHFLELDPMPLELLFIFAATIAGSQLWYLGFSWEQIVRGVMDKLGKALPTIFILFAIGLVIGTWIIAGTIPMFVYYGIKIIHPSFIYFLALIIPILFSTFTGTSWGSVGTVGVVIIGIASVIDANLAITAGAIIGGAYFGDKMSPLSDTTNMAALATDVDLYDHIKSMMYTTIPSALIAAVIYLVMGWMDPPQSTNIDSPQITATLDAIDQVFNFNIFLILPVIVVLVGSYKRMPTIPVLIASSLLAAFLAFVCQQFTISNILATMHHGFDIKMATWQTEIPDSISKLFNRGGLYALSEPIIIALFVFVYIGMIAQINAMPILVNKIFGWAKSRTQVIVASLFSSAFTNGMTSNQYATSFIVGEAFKSKYDQLKIPRKVLSRSIEDYGTMIESIIPWTPSAIFVVASLGVPFGEYWYWQLLTIINLFVALVLAFTGWGCFYKLESE